MKNFLMQNARVVFGACGGVAGAVFSQLAPEGDLESASSLIFATAIWFGINMAVVSLALAWGAGVHQRRFAFPRELAFKIMLGGAFAGCVAGGVAQLVFGSIDFESEGTQELTKAACWGVAGGTVGVLLCRVVPNMSWLRGGIGGFLGGGVGGGLFVGSYALLGEIPEFLGHAIGIGVLGAAMGLSLGLADRLYRKAWLEILWAPKETTTVALGLQPVRIGGGDDHVYVHGLTPGAMNIVMEGGDIVLTRSSKSGQDILKDGSLISVGSVQVKVHAQS